MILEDKLVKRYLRYHYTSSDFDYYELKDFFVSYKKDGQILDDFFTKSKLGENKKALKSDYKLFSITEWNNFYDYRISKAHHLISEGKDEGLILSSLMRLFKRQEGEIQINLLQSNLPYYLHKELFLKAKTVGLFEEVYTIIPWFYKNNTFVAYNPLLAQTYKSIIESLYYINDHDLLEVFLGHYCEEYIPKYSMYDDETMFFHEGFSTKEEFYEHIEQKRNKLLSNKKSGIQTLINLNNRWEGLDSRIETEVKRQNKEKKEYEEKQQVFISEFKRFRDEESFVRLGFENILSPLIGVECSIKSGMSSYQLVDGKPNTNIESLINYMNVFHDLSFNVCHIPVQTVTSRLELCFDNYYRNNIQLKQVQEEYELFKERYSHLSIIYKIGEFIKNKFDEPDFLTRISIIKRIKIKYLSSEEPTTSYRNFLVFRNEKDRLSSVSIKTKEEGKDVFDHYNMQEIVDDWAQTCKISVSHLNEVLEGDHHVVGEEKEVFTSGEFEYLGYWQDYEKDTGINLRILKNGKNLRNEEDRECVIEEVLKFYNYYYKTIEKGAPKGCNLIVNGEQDNLRYFVKACARSKDAHSYNEVRSIFMKLDEYYYFRGDSIIDWFNDIPFLFISYKSFEASKAYARNLNLESIQAWKDFVKTENKPSDIPSNPETVYKDTGWTGYRDFLGYKIKRGNNFLPYEEAQKITSELGLQSQQEWRDFAKTDEKPVDIPSRPEKVYKDIGWTGYRDFLRYELKVKNNFLSFDDAQNITTKLGLKSEREWREFSKTEGKPINIPSRPEKVYKDSGWKGYSVFLGYKSKRGNNFLDYDEAVNFVGKLELQSYNEWKEYCILGDKPSNIPSQPSTFYENKGWIDIYNWLGTERPEYIVRKDNIFLNYHEASSFIKKLNLTSYLEWLEFKKNGILPSTIPANPERFYKDKGWIDIYDWLGINTPSTNDKKGGSFLNYQEAETFVRSLNLSSSREWVGYIKSGMKPSNIPSKPDRVYKDKGWEGYQKWLGSNNVSNTKREWLSYNEAREIVINEGVVSHSTWKEYLRSGKRPLNVPAKPEKVYEGNDWIGFGHWFGKDE